MQRSKGHAFLTLLCLMVVGTMFQATAKADPGPYISPNWASFGGDSFSSSRPLVAAPYFYWYHAQSGYHMSMTEHPDYWYNPHHPAMSFSNPPWHALEAARMKSAGIDICLPVYWGGNPQSLPYEEHWSNAGLDALAQGMASNTQAGVRNPAVGMFYDTHTLTGLDLESPAGWGQFYRTIRDFYSRVPPKRWARIDGRAVVWLYSSSYPARISGRAFTEARRRFAQNFGGVQLMFIGNTGWRTPDAGRLVDMTYAWGAAGRHDGIISAYDVVSIGPGINYAGDPVNPPQFVDRRGGQVYRGAWEAALRTGKKLVFIETWQENGEATSIAPTLEHGWREWETTRHYSNIFHSR